MHMTTAAWERIGKGLCIIMLTFLSACGPLMFYEIQNNTGHDVLVQMTGDNGEWDYANRYEYIKVGDSKRFVWPIVSSHGFDVMFPEVTWRYDGVRPITNIWPFLRTTYLQIQPDEKMYAFTGCSLPDTIHEGMRQPKGYPRLPVIIPQGIFTDREQSQDP